METNMSIIRSDYKNPYEPDYMYGARYRTTPYDTPFVPQDSDIPLFGQKYQELDLQITSFEGTIKEITTTLSTLGKDKINDLQTRDLKERIATLLNKISDFNLHNWDYTNPPKDSDMADITREKFTALENRVETVMTTAKTTLRELSELQLYTVVDKGMNAIKFIPNYHFSDVPATKEMESYFSAPCKTTQVVDRSIYPERIQERTRPIQAVSTSSSSSSSSLKKQITSGLSKGFSSAWSYMPSLPSFSSASSGNKQRAVRAATTEDLEEEHVTFRLEERDEGSITPNLQAELDQLEAELKLTEQANR